MHERLRGGPQPPFGPRSFTPTPVPDHVLRRVFTAAARSPSSGNLQPWNLVVVRGTSLARIKQCIAKRIDAADAGDAPDFTMYPARLPSPYSERRIEASERRYGAMGIARDDTAARTAAVRANWNAFGVPAVLFCYIDRCMGSAQWADLGMYLQTVMLLLREEGLHSCTQMAWTVYARSIAQVVHPPDGWILCCGLSVGSSDPRALDLRSTRAPFEETVRFMD